MSIEKPFVFTYDASATSNAAADMPPRFCYAPIPEACTVVEVITEERKPLPGPHPWLDGNTVWNFRLGYPNGAQHISIDIASCPNLCCNPVKSARPTSQQPLNHSAQAKHGQLITLSEAGDRRARKSSNSIRKLAQVTTTAGCADLRPPGVPTLLLGDVFAPCNALGLLQPQSDLDQLFLSGSGLPVNKQLPAAALPARHNDSSSSVSSNQSDIPAASLPASAQQGGLNASDSANAGQEFTVVQDFASGIENLKRSWQRQHTASPNTDRASASDSLTSSDLGPIHATMPDINIGQELGPQSLLVPSAGQLLKTQKAAFKIDPGTQLLVRTMMPVQGKRLFLVSPHAANALRRMLVLDRHKSLKAQQAQETAALTPATAATSAAPAGLPQPGNAASWWNQLSDWLDPSTSRQLPPINPIATGRITAHPGSAVDVAAQPSSKEKSTANGIGNATQGSNAGIEGSSEKQSSPPQRSAKQQEGSVMKGPLQVLPIVTRLVAKALTPAGLLDFKSLESATIATEARHILAGGVNNPPGLDAPISYVGRVPFMEALSLAMSAPQQFGLVPPGGDARIAQAAHGKPALLDLRAATKDKWVLRVEDEDSDSASSAIEEDQETSIMEPMPHKTPIFQLPGVTIALRTQAGQRVHFTPAFLSMSQLHVFVDASKAVARSVWCGARQASREAGLRKLETAVIALSGLNSISQTGGPAAPGRTNSAEDDDDEDGMGELPEAKALLEELGEGKGSQASARLGTARGPPGGLPALLSTLAVGSIMLAGQGAAALAGSWDQMLVHSPWGLKAVGLPDQLAVRTDFLEPCLQRIKQENEMRHIAWAAKQHRKHKLVQRLSKNKDDNKKQNVPAVSASEPPVGSSNDSNKGQGHDRSTVQSDEVMKGSNTDDGATQIHVDPASIPQTDLVFPHLREHDKVEAGVPGVESQTPEIAKQQGVQSTEGEPPTAGLPLVKSSKHKPQHDVLESVTGLSMLTDAAWAVLHEARHGDGQLSAMLAPTWTEKARVSAANESELAVMLAVRLNATKLPPAALASYEGQRQKQAGFNGGDLIDANRVRDETPLTAVMGLSLPKGVGETKTHNFEIGVHLHTGKMSGEVAHDEPDMLSNHKSALKGMLLIADLGLDQNDMLGGLQLWGTPPPLGFTDLAPYFGATQQQANPGGSK